jgi:hypothetical protein
MMTGSPSTNYENTIYPLSCWRERVGVRVDMIKTPPSLSPRDIPYSLIFERGAGLHPLPEGRGKKVIFWVI